jgi:hypothetical protein
MLLANGKAVPISSLKPGDKLVATNTKTGKTQAGTIAAVLNKYKSGSQERPPLRFSFAGCTLCLNLRRTG